MAGGSGGDLDSTSYISGATDDTPIGNVGDRLKVDFSASPNGSSPIIPAGEVTFCYDTLKNGGSPEMNVNGSSTPVEFSAGPGASETWYITELIIALQDSGDVNLDDYGAINVGMNNGILIEHSRDGTDYTLGTAKTNLDLAMLFNSMGHEGNSNGYLNDGNIFVGVARLKPEITLIGSTSDVIKCTVRDNLTGLTSHRISYRAWKII